MKDLTKEEFHSLAIKFLLYSFEFPNHIVYEELTQIEKKICDKDQFAALIRYIKTNEN